MSGLDLILYVDGFNLYKRRLQGSPFKWLNLATMADLLFQDFTVTKVRYFTAAVKHQPHDPHVRNRQLTYLRALATESRVSVHEGHFRLDKVPMPVHPLEYDDSGRPVTVLVRKTEEKGSDVNLASHLLMDAFTCSADAFAVLSNDSDLAEPMRMVRQDLRRMTALVTPDGSPAAQLIATRPSTHRQLRDGLLEAAQFPAIVRDEHGSIRRPGTWGSKAEAPGSPGPRTQ